MVLTISIYLLAGLIFGIWFLVAALPRRDANAQGAGWGFRVLVLPCSILLWPLLLTLYRRGGGSGREASGWLQGDWQARLRHARIWSVLPWLLAVLLVVAILFRRSS